MRYKVHFYKRLKTTKRWTTMDDTSVLDSGHEHNGQLRFETTTFTKYGTVFAAMTDEPHQTLYAMAVNDTLYRGESHGGVESKSGVKYRSSMFARNVHEYVSSKRGVKPTMKDSEAVKQNIQLRAALANLIDWADDLLDSHVRRLYGSRVDHDVPALRRARNLLEVR